MGLLVRTWHRQGRPSWWPACLFSVWAPSLWGLGTRMKCQATALCERGRVQQLPFPSCCGENTPRQHCGCGFPRHAVWLRAWVGPPPQMKGLFAVMYSLGPEPLQLWFVFIGFRAFACALLHKVLPFWGSSDNFPFVPLSSMEAWWE